VHALTISSAIAIGLGGQAELPHWPSALAAFDEELAEPIGEDVQTAADYNSARATKMRALGVR
jgi:hypothetical protein